MADAGVSLKDRAGAAMEVAAVVLAFSFLLRRSEYLAQGDLRNEDLQVKDVVTSSGGPAKAVVAFREAIAAASH